jgi:hypothetical protein
MVKFVNLTCAVSANTSRITSIRINEWQNVQKARGKMRVA